MQPRSLLTYAACALLAAGCSTDNTRPVALTAPSLTVTPGSDSAADRRFGKGHVPHQKVGRDASPTSSQRGEMYYHGGSVMVSNVTYAIFNGPDWQVNGTFTSDKISSVESFLSGIGGSNINVPGSLLSRVLQEYYGQGNNISTTSSYLGRLVDNGAALSADASAQTVGQYVCNQLGLHGIQPRTDAVYIVFTEDPIGSRPLYGWHSNYQNSSVCGNTNLHFAFIFNLDGKFWVSADTAYHRTSNAATLVNSMSHELFETITDPNPGSPAWYAVNVQGEIGDKCNFVFSGYVTLLNGDRFKVQTEWSNIAFELGEGVPDYYGERGCMNIPPVQANISGPATTMDDNTYTWTAYAGGGLEDGQYTYQWVVDYDSGVHWVGGTGSTQSLTTHASDGNFTIRVTASSGGFSGTWSQYVRNGCSQTWQNNVAYYEGDIVCYGSQAFQSTLDGNIGFVPYDGSPYWTLLQ